MQTKLAPQFQNTPEGRAAESVLRQCVHCGFCNATCPTYKLLGDELDGPRGRIYLMKQVFEGAPVTRETQQHLDRCIGCRHCETTCPSGVRYSELLEVGQQVVDQAVPRSRADLALRWLLRHGLASKFFKPALGLGRAVRGALPRRLRDLVPLAPALAAPPWPTAEQQALHTRQVVLLKGCVQPGLRPHVDAATARVLDACGVRTMYAKGSGCCGALHAHLGDHDAARAAMRRNIDAWWPLIQGLSSDGKSSKGTSVGGRGASGVRAEALVINASGCGAMVKEYGHWLADDPAYANKARRVSEWARDIGEWLPELLPAMHRRMRTRKGEAPPQLGAVTYHPPCSLSHAQRQIGHVEGLMRELGFEVNLATNDPLQCCGAGGAYSVLQPELSKQLRTQKLEQLQADRAAVIASANIGCITHLQAGTNTPVKHWIELVDEALSRGA